MSHHYLNVQETCKLQNHCHNVQKYIMYTPLQQNHHTVRPNVKLHFHTSYRRTAYLSLTFRSSSQLPGNQTPNHANDNVVSARAVTSQPATWKLP